jgi:Mg/Co/Ni transporter MgtE
VIEVDYDSGLPGAMPDKTAENEFIKEVHVLLNNGEEEALQIFLRRARPEDIAEWLDVLSADDRQRIVGVEPAVASGPLVSTINDSLALAVYFSVATAMLLILS